MRPNLDTAISAKLPGAIRPALLLQLALNSGTEYVWSGVGDLNWNGHTWKGLGMFASMAPITENSEVMAEGTSVTLSGIGASDLPFPPLGFTPPALPRPMVSGESVAWSPAGGVSLPQAFSQPPNIWNAFLGCHGNTSISLTSGGLGMTNGEPIGPNAVSIEWSDFRMPLEVPIGATVTGVYPMAATVIPKPGGYMNVYAANSVSSRSMVPFPGASVGGDIGTPLGWNIIALLQNTLEGAADLAFGVVGPCMAVYYMGVPLTAPRLLHEALMDIRLGAPAKIWLALLDDSPALIGTPYRLFAGTVDKPSVKVSPDGSSITIAFENRLVNLQRPNNRKYTSADQHLYYPTDMGFNWVEILQEISLKQGS